MVKSNNFSWMYEHCFYKSKQIFHFILAKRFSHFSHFSTMQCRGSQSHRTLYLVKMNRAYCLCDLYQYEVKKESQSKDLRRGGGIVAKLHYAWSHLAPATLQLSSTTTTTTSLSNEKASSKTTCQLRYDVPFTYIVQVFRYTFFVKSQHS